MKQMYGYIRVSSQKQGEGVSLEAQKEAIQGFASRRGFAITEWFEELKTAAKSGRPVFDAMVKALKAGQADGMIIHRIDRSSRNIKDWATISDLSDIGVEVHFASESMDFRSRGGRLTADIQAVIAADYIRNLSIEARKGIEGRLKQGLYPWAAPIGYLDHGRGQVKTLDPVRAPLVRELFERYLTGNYSIRTLHLKMCERGLTNRAGKPICKRNVEHVLQNPFYYGQMRNGRTGKMYPGQHEPLITACEFQQITAIKAGRYVKKQTKHDRPFRRLFHCQHCGASLSPELQKGRVYYRCHTTGCRTRTIREDRLNEVVRDALKQVQLAAEASQWLSGQYEAWDTRKARQEMEQATDIKLQNAEARLARLTDLLIDDKIDAATHDAKRQDVLLEIDAARAERRNIDDRVASARDHQKFGELMKSLTGLYQNAKTGERRIIVEMCFANRTWDGECVCLKPSNIVEHIKRDEPVPIGGPIRDTIRTFVRRTNTGSIEKKPKNGT